MHNSQKLLIIDDNHDDISYVTNLLGNCEIINLDNFSNLDDLIDSFGPDLMVINFELLNRHGPSLEDLCPKLVSVEVPVLFILDRETKKTAISNLTHLPYDYIVRPLEEEELLLRVKNLLELNRLTKREKLLNQKLLESLKMMNIITIGSKLSHDIRNMLGPIMCYSEMLIRHCSTGTKADEYIQKIKESIERLKQDTKNLQDCLSSVRSSPAPVNVNELVTELFNLYRDRGENSQIKLHVLEDAPEVKIDRNQILYALANIIVNLSEASLFSGDIDISIYPTTEVPISKDGKVIGFLEDNYAVISIAFSNKDETIYDLIGVIEATNPPYSEPEKLAFRTTDVIVRRNEGFLKIGDNNDKLEFNIYLPIAN